ncbi:MAG: hypothetical protein LBL39_04875 [Planctomycetaceae bacterium]|nr:hypothetical protein [Planctomycetaceae bacterium]
MGDSVFLLQKFTALQYGSHPYHQRGGILLENRKIAIRATPYFLFSRVTVVVSETSVKQQYTFFAPMPLGFSSACGNLLVYRLF